MLESIVLGFIENADFIIGNFLGMGTTIGSILFYLWIRDR